MFVLWMMMSGLLCLTFLCVIIGLSHSTVVSVCMTVSFGSCFIQVLLLLLLLLSPYSYCSLLSVGRTLICQGYSSRGVRFSFGVMKLLIILAVPSKVFFVLFRI